MDSSSTVIFFEIATSEISVADVIQAIDGPVLVTACSDINENCEQYEKCNVLDPLWQLKNRLIESLKYLSESLNKCHIL